MREKVQALVDKVYEDTMFQSSPRVQIEHPAMKELVLLPKTDVTEVLLEMLDTDPNWTILIALREIQGDDGAEWPEDDNGRFENMVKHWLVWGQRQGLFSALLDTDEAEP